MLLNEMEIFYYVVKLSSFSKAAQQLNVSNSHVSKKISKLEAELQAKLLTRSTRQLVLTEVGKIFYEHCARLVEEASEGYSAVSELRDEPFGSLRITAPPAFALYVLQPVVTTFIKKYPRVTVSLELETRINDIISEGIDLALRGIPLKDSTLIAQQCYHNESALVATPAYLAEHGTPKTLQDLSEHKFGLYRAHQVNRTLEIDKEKQTLDAHFESNNLDMIRLMVLDSLCIAPLPKFMVKKELASKALTQLFPEKSLEKSTLYAVYPSREFVPLKLRLFLDLLKEALQS